MLKPVLFAALAAFASPVLAGPTLLTSADGYTGRGLDLSAYKNEIPDFTFGPINVDGYSFTAAPGTVGSTTNPYGGNTGLGAFVGQDTVFGYYLGGNGELGGEFTFLGLDSGEGSMQLLGSTGYQQLGFNLSYYIPEYGNDPTIWTLDQAGNVLDEFNLSELAPISTPDGLNETRFRGVAYDDGTLIYGMRFGGSFLIVGETPAGDVVSGIPEPASWAMLIAGFGLVGMAARRRQPQRALSTRA